MIHYTEDGHQVIKRIPGPYCMLHDIHTRYMGSCGKWESAVPGKWEKR